jgi:hypothetical protein
MDSAIHVQSVFQVLSGGKSNDQSPVLRSAIQRDQDSSLAELADVIYRDPVRRGRLSKLYSSATNYSSGGILLTLSEFSDLLFDSLETADVYYPSDDGLVTIGASTYIRCDYYRNASDLELPHVSGIYNYSFRNGSILIRDENGIILDNATVLIYANKIPTLTNLPTEFDNDLVNISIGRMKQGRASMAA